jgi:transmembrane sensor
MSRQFDSAAFPQDPRLPEAMEQAGDWLLCLREDDVTPETIEAWLRWYHEDAAHRQAFRELQDEYERLKAVPGTRRRQMARQVLAGTEAVAQDTGETAAPRRAWRSRLSAGFAIAATLVLGVAIGLWQLTPPPPGEADAVYRTERGAHQVLNLPDGSVVTLGARSSASSRFTENARRVELETGEAFFEVARDSARPFLVEVGGMTVRAVGTAFNVRRSTDMVVVSVSEGTVDVERGAAPGLPTLVLEALLPDPEPVRLTSGKRAVVSAVQREVLSVKPANPASAQSWQSGRLEFVDEPLSVVIATVNRYSDRDIVLTDRDLGKVPLTGAVMHDHIEEWLLALPDVFPLHVEVAANNSIRVSPTQNHVADTR